MIQLSGTVAVITSDGRMIVVSGIFILVGLLVANFICTFWSSLPMQRSTSVLLFFSIQLFTFIALLKICISFMDRVWVCAMYKASWEYNNIFIYCIILFASISIKCSDIHYKIILYMFLRNLCLIILHGYLIIHITIDIKSEKYIMWFLCMKILSILT